MFLIRECPGFVWGAAFEFLGVSRLGPQERGRDAQDHALTLLRVAPLETQVGCQLGSVVALQIQAVAVVQVLPVVASDGH
eukprot:3180200-Heterocapsa_arctica.AAC.1